MKKTKIHAFILPFHYKKSHSHLALLEKPLSADISFQFESWDGTNLPQIKDRSLPLLFFQYPPPISLFSNPNTKLIWIPMWDHIQQYHDSFWERIPKNVKIIAFTEAINKICTKFKLNYHSLKYHSNLGMHNKVNWKNSRNMFYWNRIGLIGKDDLTRLCRLFHINTLYFQNQLDPGILEKLNYSLPAKINNTRIITLPHYLPRKTYLQILSKTNVYIAPRLAEGAGLSFLEALSFGCAVLGYNAPSMNEYIKHKKNGYLFKDYNDSFIYKLKTAVTIRLPKFLGGQDFIYKLNENWQELENIDLENMGNTAYVNNLEGRLKWEEQLPNLINYLTVW